MRQFLPCRSFAAAMAMAPSWASVIVGCRGGFMAFECDADRRIWERWQ